MQAEKLTRRHFLKNSLLFAGFIPNLGFKTTISPFHETSGLAEQGDGLPSYLELQRTGSVFEG